jgi:oxygen-independent coproporphyrinogen-3 oxidase
VQTFSPAIQAAIGRVQPAEMIEAAVRELRGVGVGVGSINFDLMYGLPGQSAAELEDTLDRTLALRPERIALFGYAHVPHLLPRQRRIDGTNLPGGAERFAQAAAGHDRLVGAGYVPVGFDHFALPDDALAVAAAAGTLRRNFQGFTDDPGDILIGLGASAISSFAGLYAQNEKNAGRYRMRVSGGCLPANRGIVRSREDQRRGRIVEALLCTGEADITSACLGQAITRLQPFRTRGLVEFARGTLRITPQGLPYSRVIASMFDSYRQPDLRRFSSAI